MLCHGLPFHFILEIFLFPLLYTPSHLFRDFRLYRPTINRNFVDFRFVGVIRNPRLPSLPNQLIFSYVILNDVFRL